MITNETANLVAPLVVIRYKVTRLELIPMAVVIDKFRAGEAHEIVRVCI